VNLDKFHRAYAAQSRGSARVRDLLGARKTRTEKFIQKKLRELKKLSGSETGGGGLTDKDKALIKNL